MDAAEKERLEKLGFRVGTVAEFLELTPAEEALIEMKLALGDELRRLRNERGLTQAALAEAIRSSQSRVAKMEAGDPGVSLDLLVRTMMEAGATRSDLAGIISGAQK